MSDAKPYTGASHPSGLWALAVGAIGVVYGDIGTSPLYAFREAAHHLAGQGGEFARADILGILSLILWALTIIVTLKYVTLLLRIDNRGEGGTLALMALARGITYRNTTAFLFLGMLGAALFYGDAIITPAISVLSAVEGLKVVAPASGPFVLPITIMIIVGLFAIQSRGTGRVSVYFGPITSLWFAVLGLTGLYHVLQGPDILAAVNPWHALKFLVSHGGLSFFVLGSVFLAVTGAEALYADLGHFGRRPIQLAWGWFIFPCLVLNYLGQGAMLLKNPDAIDNTFFRLVPDSLQLPLVILATLATVIAAQAVITGAFSLTKQASNLGLLPRLTIRHTSDQHSGQIYMPHVNYLLMAGVILLVILFQSSSNLAATYGISVTGAMVVDAIMVGFVIWQVWEWPFWKTALIVLPFLLIETVFLSANLMKIADGGWVPLSLAVALVIVMYTWIKGNFIINSRARKKAIKVDRFIRTYAREHAGLQKAKGLAFFMASDPQYVPGSLLQNMVHNKVLHEKNILLSVKIETVPYVAPDERRLVTPLDDRFTQVVLRFGFKDDLNVQNELIRLNEDPDSGISFDWQEASVFLSRRSLKSHPRYGLPLWQDLIFIWLNRHASEPTDFYKLPVSRVIEIGKQVII